MPGVGRGVPGVGGIGGYQGGGTTQRGYLVLPGPNGWLTTGNRGPAGTPGSLLDPSAHLPWWTPPDLSISGSQDLSISGSQSQDLSISGSQSQDLNLRISVSKDLSISGSKVLRF